MPRPGQGANSTVLLLPLKGSAVLAISSTIYPERILTRMTSVLAQTQLKIPVSHSLSPSSGIYGSGTMGRVDVTPLDSCLPRETMASSFQSHQPGYCSVGVCGLEGPKSRERLFVEAINALRSRIAGRHYHDPPQGSADMLLVLFVLNSLLRERALCAEKSSGREAEEGKIQWIPRDTE